MRCSLLTDETGVLEEILPRQSYLERPLVANVDQVLVMCAAAAPSPNLSLIDRLLVTAEFMQLPAIVGVNKADLDTEGTGAALKRLYENIGYPCFFFSLKQAGGLEELKRHLSGHVTVLAGQSGVGKSSLLNTLVAERVAETGSVSQRSGQGRHTTKHVELLPLPPPIDGFLVDTPGFSRLQLPADLQAAQLDQYFPELRRFAANCRFGSSCAHLQEPDCAVQEALQSGLVAQSRMDSYRQLYQELDERERRY